MAEQKKIPCSQRGTRSNRATSQGEYFGAENGPSKQLAILWSKIKIKKLAVVVDETPSGKLPMIY
jgi:hypothetical protein